MDVRLKSWPSGGLISLCLPGLALEKNDMVFELSTPFRKGKVEASDTDTESHYIHPCVKAEYTVSHLQTFKQFLGSAVLACRESLAVLNRVGVVLIVHRPITNTAGSNSFLFLTPQTIASLFNFISMQMVLW